MRHSWLAPLLRALGGCVALTLDSLGRRFGPADPTRFDRLPAAYARWAPLEAGLLGYSHLENR